MGRLVILSNSMGMPRPWLEGTDRSTIDCVYGSLLARRFAPRHHVDNVFLHELDSENAVRAFAPIVSLRQPDVVVLHIGIIDCAPRLFRKGGRHLFLQPWFRGLTRNAGVRLMKKYRSRITRHRRIVYVGLGDFERNMRALEEGVREYRSDVTVYAVAIARVAIWLDQYNFGYLDNIERYNAVLRRVFGERYIEVNDLLPTEELLISDGYHLSLPGHAALADRIADEVGELLDGPSTSATPTLEG